MSEKNEKHLHNRLDSIFDDLDDPTHLPGMSIFNQHTGWIWEIDDQGRFTNCSPDVEPLLGYEARNLLGQTLSSFSNFDLEAAELPTDPATPNPKVIRVTFFHLDGSKQDAVCHFLPLHQSGKLVGWRGMTIVEAEEPSAADLESSDIQPYREEIPLPLPDLTSTGQQISPPAPISSSNGETEPAELEETEHAEEESLSYEELYVAAAYQPNDEIREFLARIDSDPNREWNPDEIQLVEQVHSQLELALENANLFQQTQMALAETDEQARRLRLLNELSEKLGQASHMQEIYESTAASALQIFAGSSTSIVVREDEFLQVRAASGKNEDLAPGDRIPLDDAPQYRLVEQQRILVASRLNNPDLPEIRSLIAGAMVSQGKVIGAINIGSDQPGQFEDEDSTFMAQLLSIVNASIENRNLLDRIQAALASTEEQARRLAVLNQMSERLGQANRLQEIISITMEMMDSIIPCKVCSTAIHNSELNAYLVYDLDENGRLSADPQLMAADNTMIHRIAEEKRLLSDYNLQDTPYFDIHTWVTQENINTMIGAPLMSGEKVIGTIMVGNQNDFTYSLQDEALLLSISSILASTLDNRQLFQQIQRRSIQLETSAEVSQIASTMLDPNELLPEVVERIKTGFDLYYAGIFLVDEDGSLTGEPDKWAVLRAGSGEAGQAMVERQHKLEIGGTSMIGKAVSAAKAQVAQDVTIQENFFRNPALPETKSEMALPLVSRGQVLGALTIQSERESAFSNEDVTSLQTMADQLANAIENARLFEQTEARAKELLVLNDMARAYTQTMDVDKLLQHTYTYTNRLLDAENFYLALFNDQNNTIEIRLLIEDNHRVAPPEPKFVLGNGLTDWIIINKVPVLIPKDVEKEMEAMGIEFPGKPSKSYLGVPMLIGAEVIGVIAIQSYTKDNNYTNHDLDLLSAVASQAAVAVDNALRFQQTQSRAQFEAVMREITTRVHSSTNPEAILKTAVREVSHALGRQAYIELTSEEQKLDSGQLRPFEQQNPESEPVEGEEED